MARYDLNSARRTLDREALSHRSRGLWRWFEFLPLYQSENIVSLGEGDTPLLPLRRLGARLGLNQLYVKDESLNPTGSFKARGLSVAVSKAKELNLARLIIPTAGNAGGALASYAARAGLQACIYMPRDTPAANYQECVICGANVILVDGLISDAARLVAEKSKADDWFDLSTFKEPYRMEGKKVMGFELAEAFHWELPEVIIYPTGGGTGLVGMWKAFQELEELGWLEKEKRPRLVSVQASGCAPVVSAYKAGAQQCELWQDAQTIASGLRVPKSFADRQILADIYASQGIAIAVSDDEIIYSQKMLASSDGIFAAPEGAATLAALEKLVIQKWVEPDERVVLFNTGSGLKYLK